MIDDGDKEKIDAQFSMLDARARKRRRRSIIVTVVLTCVTGWLVLRLARDIVDKQAEVQRVETSRGELDKRLKSEQEKLEAAVETREKLEAEIKDLEATKKSYQNRILSEKDAHNMGLVGGSSNGKTPPPGLPPDESQAGTNPRLPTDDVAGRLPDTSTLVIEESGKAPAGFFIKPIIKVVPAIGNSGREIFKIQLELDIPEAKRGDVERVTYHLSPKYYLRNALEGGAAPTFVAKFNVFACESTVLGRVHLRDGTTLAVDFDWCREEGWPPRKKEPVIVVEENPPGVSSNPVIAAPPPPRTPPPIPTPRIAP